MVRKETQMALEAIHVQRLADFQRLERVHVSRRSTLAKGRQLLKWAGGACSVE